jgi:hypothetical protein
MVHGRSRRAEVTQQQHGHCSIQITFDRYGHRMPGNEEGAAEVLDSYLRRSSAIS